MKEGQVAHQDAAEQAAHYRMEGELRTVLGLRFYQHAETPGLGGNRQSQVARAMGWQEETK